MTVHVALLEVEISGRRAVVGIQDLVVLESERTLAARWQVGVAPHPVGLAPPDCLLGQ